MAIPLSAISSRPISQKEKDRSEKIWNDRCAGECDTIAEEMYRPYMNPSHWLITVYEPSITESSLST